MTTVTPDTDTGQRTLELLTRHRDVEVERAAQITDKVGRIGIWLRERTVRGELTLNIIDQVVNDLSTEREALADALENTRCYEALLARTGGVQPVEAAARAAVGSSQPLRPVDPDEPGPDRTESDAPGPSRNGGAPVVHSTLGGLVCAVEQRHGADGIGLLHDERWICGTPVAQGPCPQHGMSTGEPVATTSTIHTDTAPVDVQPKGKGGAK